ncbi:MAG TPA: peptide chain release factor N(5)-glutamine methyltransferase [Propionibacteriaceae bacterium]|jgi:release factor glutamine methyltransferase|nr:peptide chain release factor N(5)-glutamine methyltransferase [Propionibacteriaceae bacterium]
MSRAVRSLLTEAAGQLRAVGVESPEQEARQLLAYAAGVELARLPLLDAVADGQAAHFQALINKRSRRIPLQHLTGQAHFRYLELEVGPGVFVPRPETEVMTGWAIEELRPMVYAVARGKSRHLPVVVELGTGSGAIAKSVATELTGTRVYAIEVSEDAAAYAARNLSDTTVELHVQDMIGVLPHLNGAVDLVISNPPYIPLEAFESVVPEARDHDPLLALVAGEDGLDAIRVVVAEAARLLRPAGLLCFEHADVQGESAQQIVVDHGGFTGVRDHPDLAGRARFVTAVRRA